MGSAKETASTADEAAVKTTGVLHSSRPTRNDVYPGAPEGCLAASSAVRTADTTAHRWTMLRGK